MKDINAVLTKKILYKEYVGNKKSSRTIAKEIGVVKTTILNKLKKFNIITRTPSEAMKGNKNHLKGKTQNRGYILIYMPNHPFKSTHKYVPEHRLIIEKQINRFLITEEKVHHINKIKNDNRVENLMAFSSESAHQRFHKNINNVNINEIIFNGGKI